MRVAILSDTHGWLDPRVRALVAECDLAIHAGDIGNTGVLAQLQTRGGRVYAVLGNNDCPHKWPAHERALLRAIPWEAQVDLPGGPLVVLHGHRLPAAQRHARLRARYPGARGIVYGHSHRLAADLDTLPWVLNPGAAGRERTYGGPSCLVLNAAEHGWTLAVHRFAPRGAAQPPRRGPRARPGSGPPSVVGGAGPCTGALLAPMRPDGD